MAVTDEREHHGASSTLLRPNGQVEPLHAQPLCVLAPGYGSRRAGRNDPHTMRIASRADRRRRQRAPSDPLVGRLVDLRV